MENPSTTPNTQISTTGKISSGRNIIGTDDQLGGEGPIPENMRRIICRKIENLSEMREAHDHKLTQLYKQGRHFDRRHVQPLKNHLERHDFKNQSRTCGNFRELRLKPVRPFNEELDCFVKGERLFGFEVENREEAVQNLDDVYLRITDRPVDVYEFSSYNSLKKNGASYYAVMAGTGNFGAVPVHLEGRVYEKGTRDGKRLFGKYNNLGELDRFTYQETSSDRTSANVSKDPNDISDTYKENAQKDVNLMRQLAVKFPDRENCQYIRVRVEGDESMKEEKRIKKKTLAADVLNSKHANLLQMTQLIAEWEKEKQAQEADGAEMEEEISQDKPESRNTIPSSRENRKLAKKSKEAARQKAIRKEEELLLKSVKIDKEVSEQILAFHGAMDAMRSVFGDLWPRRKTDVVYANKELQQIIDVLFCCGSVIHLYHELFNYADLIKEYFSLMPNFDIFAFGKLQEKEGVQTTNSKLIFYGSFGEDVIDPFLRELMLPKKEKILQRHFSTFHSSQEGAFEILVVIFITCFDHFIEFLDKNKMNFSGFVDKATWTMHGDKVLQSQLKRLKKIKAELDLMKTIVIGYEESIESYELPFQFLRERNVSDWKIWLLQLSDGCSKARSLFNNGHSMAGWDNIRKNVTIPRIRY